MAEENVIKTNIVATSDMSGLISDLSRVSLALSELQQKLNVSNKALATQVAVMNKTFAETLRSTGQFSTHFVSLTSDVDKFGQQLDRGQLKLGQFFRVYQDQIKGSGGLVRQLAQQQVQLQNAILQPLGRNAEGLMQYNVHIPRGLDTVKNKAALARQELMIMNKVVQEGANQLINWGKNTQWAGRQLTVGLTVPMAAFGKAAADAFRQADEQLVRLTKVYGGLSATSNAELMKVRKDVTATASELAKSYGASFKDTLALAADIAATGKQGNELLGSIKETTRLSVLGEVDRQEAMKATLAIQTAFKQNTEELTGSINFLNAVENQTSTTLQDLVEAIPKAGPIIKGLGGSVQDLALYLTAMREGGVSAAEGANALKSALGSLINPTKVATNMFAGFGIDLKGIVTNNAGNLTKTILELQAALDTLNPLQKQQALEQLFGKFQFARMNALFSNLGKQGSQTLQVLDLMKASTTDLANIAGRELSQVTESASGRYRRALEGLKADLATVGDSFLKINTTLINIVDGVIKFAQHLPGPIKSALSFLGMLTAAAGPLIMLTGVLGNFFGYIIKGVYHFKSFFKGAEGWKLLTPEIMAANKASNLVEESMYSDARAAAVLNQALQPLIASYDRLTTAMNTGVIPVNPAFTTPAGTVATPGRQVNPTSPFLSPIDTRSMSHLEPVSGMTTERKLSQTMFGVVPGAPIVNQKILNNPQMYMSEELPRIQGVTAIGKVSTGVVASEAAKWHSMTAALAMQSKAEIAKLKAEVAATGLVTDEVSQAYNALLPRMTELTSNAAARSRQIVMELKADKITVDQARAQIIALNREIEGMMVSAAQQTAADLGRTINPTQVPLLNQPVIDPRTGKSNMKELLKKGRTRGLLNNIARALGVKTYGASYSIETTIPKRFAKGGAVYMADGGPMGTDTVPAWLTPGEYVVKKSVVDQLGTEFFDNLNNLDINRSAKPVAAHASMPAPFFAHEVMSSYGQHAPAEFGAFASAFPDQPVDVLDAQLLGLYREENDALRMGKRGLTRSELLRALSAPDKRLFKFLPDLSPSAQKVLKRKMLEYVALMSDNKMYHDDALSKVFQLAKKDTFNALGGEEKMNFLNVMRQAEKPKFIRQRSLRDLLPGEKSTMSAADARAAAAGESYPYKTPQRKHAVVVHDKSGSAFNVESYQTRQFASSILEDPSIPRGRLNTRRVPTPLRDILLTRAWRRGFAGGGKVPGYYAGGGMVTGPQYFAEENDNRLVRPSMARSFGMSALGMIPGFAGYTLGSQLTGGSMVGGLAGGMIGDVIGTTMINKLMFSAEGADKKVSLLSRGLQGLAMLPGPVKVVGALAVLAGTFKLINDKINEHRQLINQGFAPTQDTVDKLNLKYKNLNDTLTEAKARFDAIRASGGKLYASTTSAGIPGITLTIQQLKDLKESVQKDFPDLIDIFNKAKPDEIVAKASQLKAQFVAGGMSAQEATNLIYTLISQSNDANLAIKAIASDGFRKIKDEATAAAASVKTFTDLVSKGNTDQIAAGLDQVVNSLTAAENKLIGTLDNQSKTIDAGEAFKITLQKINDLTGKQGKLSTDQINALKSQNVILGSILSGSETLASVYAKIKMYTAGINVDLRSLNSDQAQALATGITSGTSYLSSAAGPFAALTKKINEQSKASKANSAAALKSIDDQKKAIQNQIDLRQKDIDLIKKQADARRKALDEEISDSNYLTEIKKKQMEYQNALAAGDFTAAARAQLDIQQMTNQQQTELAKRAITDKENKDVEAKQAEIDKLQAQLKSLENKVQAANDAAGAATKKVDYYQGLLNDAISAVFMSLNGYDDTEKSTIKDIQKRLIAGGFSDIAAMISADVSGKNGIAPGEALADKILKVRVTNWEGIKDYLNRDVTSIDTSKYLGQKNTKYGGGVGPLANLPSGKNRPLTDANGLLTGEGIDAVIKDYKLKVGQYFEFNGQQYVVKSLTGLGGPHAVRVGRAMGGYIKNFGPGGGVSGPGTGTSDSIPAMLSNGEYVIRATSVQKYGKDLFDAFNTQRFALGGMANPRYNIPSSSLIVNPATMRYNNGGQVNRYDVGGLVVNAAPGQDERQIAAMVVQMLDSKNLMAQAKSGRNRS